MQVMQLKTEITKASAEYELIDSGEEERLERFGAYVLARPDPQALWRKRRAPEAWEKADAWYERKGATGSWHMKKDVPRQWPIQFGGLTFLIRPTSFKHVGLFPEQLPNCEWIEKVISTRTSTERIPKVLNLFAYTGGATLIAAKAGAEVVHLDASKSAVDWARENAEWSGLGNSPVRWIVDDAVKFVTREVKRGNRYDAIIMDPPAFGHGPKDELWKIEEHFLGLLESCGKLLIDDPLFVLLNGYAAGYSSLVFKQNLEALIGLHKGSVSQGELTIEESSGNRLLPSGIYARYAR